VDYSGIGSIVTLSAFGVLNKGSLGSDLLVSVEEIVGSNILGDVIDLGGATTPAATSTEVNLGLGRVTINGSSLPLPLSFTVSLFENVRGSNLVDLITGNAANNSLSGASGNDTIDGGAGNDTINGGSGIDTASYASASAGVSVSLAFQGVAQNTLNAGSDLLISIENLYGSSFADTLSGNIFSNLISGGAGNDTINGSSGNDTIDGGSGTDIANYSSLGGLVTLGAFGLLNKGGLGIDNLIGIETIVGSRLLGDTVDHSAAISSGGVIVSGTNTNLTTGVVTVNGTGAPLPLTFNVQQFENVIGSNFNDTIIGNTANNSLTGGAGNDTILGDNIVSIPNPIFSFNNKFYTLGTAAPWTQAQAQAVSLGGNLVTVNDAAENQFLVNTFGGAERLWIGLTDEVTEGVFRWANGEAITYTNWASGEPNNLGNEDYAEFNFGGPGRWNDLPVALLPLRGIIEINNSADTLVGGLGSDTLTGGLGNDVFKYTTATESAAGVTSRDTITDFQLGADKLDLGAIDANSLFALDQAFSFLGNSATFTSAGQLRYQVTGGNLFLLGNIDANFATSEFELQLLGLANITASDIIL
jgi:serralysin